MILSRNFKHAAFFLSAAFLLVRQSDCRAAAQAGYETAIQTMTPPAAVINEPEKQDHDEFFFDTHLEPNSVIQGNRTGRWIESISTYGYKKGNVSGYLSISEYERFDDKDYTVSAGSYVTLNNGYAHFEAAQGWDIDYLYHFQAIAEAGHKLYSTLYWQIGYNFRDYTYNDTHLVYPGLIYYFGDSYMSFDYGISYIESSDTATFGSFKGDFALTSFLHWYGSAAFGQRLYDIYGLDARKEYGYILSTGLKLTLYKQISLRAGYSYGAEKPKFIKRGFNFGLNIRF